MDDKAVEAKHGVFSADATILAIDGVEVASFASVVQRLCQDYPDVSARRIESVLLREWEAFTAGRPLVLPVAVEAGAREILDLPR